LLTRLVRSPGMSQLMNIWDEVPKSVLDFAYRHAEIDHILVYRLNMAEAKGSRLQAW
jgi:hypothetical protein